MRVVLFQSPVRPMRAPRHPRSSASSPSTLRIFQRRLALGLDAAGVAASRATFYRPDVSRIHRQIDVAMDEAQLASFRRRPQRHGVELLHGYDCILQVRPRGRAAALAQRAEPTAGSNRTTAAPRTNPYEDDEPPRARARLRPMRQALVEGIDSARLGDALLLRMYILEEGRTTRRILDALHAAAARGVRLHLGCDRSAVSAFARQCERSPPSLERELDALSARYPGHVSVEDGDRAPDHTKVMLLSTAQPHRRLAVVSGCNLGDRFARWADFALRIEGDGAVGAARGGAGAVSSLAAALALPHAFCRGAVRRSSPLAVGSPKHGAAEEDLSSRAGHWRWRRTEEWRRRCRLPVRPRTALNSRNHPETASHRRAAEPCVLSWAVNAPSGAAPPAWALVLQRPLEGCWGVLPALQAFFGDPQLSRITAATPYIDEAGAALVQLALQRGAAVTLIVPRQPNVYGHSNRRALSGLLASAAAARAACGSGGALTVLLHSGPAPMMHAKIAVGCSGPGGATSRPLRGYLGSANLKQRSLRQLGELVCFATGGGVPQQLGEALAALAREAQRVECGDAALIYDPAIAALEQFCG